jgi:hypothetical protein
MPKRFPWIVSAIALLVCAMALPTVVYAQYGVSTGGIFGKVVDEQGGVLPGVSVIVKGPGAPVTVYTDARGEFRVTNVDPGNYTLTVSLQGFATVNRENVTVQVGKNTELTVPMKLSAVAATVTVTGEALILETKRVRPGAGPGRIAAFRRRAIRPVCRRLRACRSTGSTWRARVGPAVQPRKSRIKRHVHGGRVNLTDMSAPAPLPVTTTSTRFRRCR